MAGLIHDIGKIAIPGEVLRKPAKLDARSGSSCARHPVEGVSMMLRMPGISSVALDSMRVCLEHHMNHDHTGYPDVAANGGRARCRASWRSPTASTP